MPSSPGGVVINQNFLELHDLVGPSRTKVLSTVAAIYDIGCLIGAIVAFTTGERLGRKKGVLVGTTIMTVGAILQASSYSLAQMFIARIVLGYVTDERARMSGLVLIYQQYRQWHQHE